MFDHFLSTYRFAPSWSGFVLEAEWSWLLYVIGAGVFLYGCRKMLAKLKGTAK